MVANSLTFSSFYLNLKQNSVLKQLKGGATMAGLFIDSGIPSNNEMAEKLKKLKQLMTKEKIIYLPNKGEANFIGDIHGDFEAVVSIVEQTGFIPAMERGEDMFLVFLGDYGDRGKKIIETIYAVISLKLMYPENVILLRGNHEEEEIALRDGTYDEFHRNYWSKVVPLFDLYCSAMKTLPAVTVTDNGIIGVHAGIPNKDIESINVLNEKNGWRNARQMRWSHPVSWEPERWKHPERKSMYFGENAFSRFMKAVPAKIMVRSHDYSENGVQLYFGNRLATIFSCGSSKSVSAHYQYRDIVRRPVFLRVDLGEEKSHFTPDDFIEVKY